MESRFKNAELSGTLLELRRPNREEQEILEDAKILCQWKNYPDEWRDLIEEDADPDVFVLKTTEGTYYLIAQNLDGHGFLTIAEQCEGPLKD